MAIDEGKLNDLIGRFVGDFGAAMHAATVVIGDKLGLYASLAERGPITGRDLALALELDVRLVEEWLAAQFVSGYAEYDPAAGTFWLTDEQAAVLADDSTQAFLVGAQTITAALWKDEELIRDAFRSGKGVGWHEHNHDLFHGTEKLFKPGYLGNLISAWIPALDGVDAKLRRGAKVADIGCGHGSSTILLAKEYPNAEITGFDYHAESIDEARKRAAEAGISDRVKFEVASAQDFGGSGYDLVCIFDALHDMGDPIGGAAHIRASLADDGTWLLVEPMAIAGLENNVNPVSRIFYAGSVGICTPAAEAQTGGYALGNQVSDERWSELLADVGFSRFRRATETPFNRVFEVRV
ncbi:MAG TPA: methyltransferase domain-containing protein [Acidimicrobiales bacterium]|jgi:SAM-dependent methyltransferase|nr:methyltransferase domain-containing protein [Acidimicrobiales bacterium]